MIVKAEYRNIGEACLVLEIAGYTPVTAEGNNSGLKAYQHSERNLAPFKELKKQGFYVPRTETLDYFNFLAGEERIAINGVPHTLVDRVWDGNDIDGLIAIGRERNFIKKGLGLLLNHPGNDHYHLCIEIPPGGK